MEVVFKNEIDNWDTVVNCRGCSSTLLIKAQDIIIGTRICYNIYADTEDDYFYVKCPVCNYATEIDRPMPAIIADKALEAFRAQPQIVKKSFSKWFPLLFGLALGICTLIVLYVE